MCATVIRQERNPNFRAHRPYEGKARPGVARIDVCERRHDTHPSQNRGGNRGLTISTLSSVIAFGEDFFTRSTSCSIAHTVLMRYPFWAGAYK